MGRKKIEADCYPVLKGMLLRLNTHRSIAKGFGVSAERIRQLKEQLLTPKQIARLEVCKVAESKRRSLVRQIQRNSRCKEKYKTNTRYRNYIRQRSLDYYHSHK